MHQKHRSTITAQGLKFCSVLTAAIILTGCQSKKPMDYLPEASGGYMGMNMESMKKSAGLKRLSEEVEKLQPGAMDMGTDKAQKVYMAFDSVSSTATKPPLFGVATGAPGFSDDVVKLYSDNGAAKVKTSGLDTYTSGDVTIAPVGDSGVLIFQDTATLDRMIAVSKKKQPGALASNEFNYVSGALNKHAFIIAGKAQPLIAMAGPMLTQFEAMNPQAAAAVKQVTMASLSFDWDANPVGEIKLHLPDKAQADVLASTINNFLIMAKNQPMLAANPDAKKVIDPVQATSAEDGVTLKVEVPADVAEKLFDQMEKAKAMKANGMMPQSQNSMMIPQQSPGNPTD